ncbi:MAG: uracil-DNA glycosylase family protein, partial [Flavobacteriaceae bacterium]
KGWEAFTDRVIATLAQQREQLVFLLWGNYAKKKAQWIDRDKHLILTAGHPSPLSANRGLWFGNRHFSQCNHYLSAVGKKPIDWALPA